MKPVLIPEYYPELEDLCRTVKDLVAGGDYEKSTELVLQAMKDYPDAPQPHNLLGILQEKEGEHLSAMRHFRAARELDPTYMPASENLNTYGTFFSRGSCAYDESDCTPA